jgi:putative salt-induced outer membrane protein YdiY
MKSLLFFSCLMFCSFLSSAQADVLTLRNGDRLSGTVVSQTQDMIVFDHELLGQMQIKRSLVETQASAAAEHPKPEKGDLEWVRKLTAGYEMASGNTEFQRFNGDFLVNRNRVWVNEWTFKGDGTLEKTKDKLSVQKGQTSLRYAYSLSKKLYNFYRVSAEHDLFENLSARIIPSTGLGYWLTDRDDLKLLGEAGAGYQWEFFRPDDEESAPILHTRAMIEKKLSDHVSAGFDHYYFPRLNEFGNYRMETEAFLRFLFSEQFALKVKAQNQYHSRPKKNAEKNDFRLVSGLEYSF